MGKTGELISNSKRIETLISQNNCIVLLKHSPQASIVKLVINGAASSFTVSMNTSESIDFRELDHWSTSNHMRYTGAFDWYCHPNGYRAVV